MGSNFSMSLTTLVIVCPFYFQRLGGCEVVSRCGLVCISPMTNELEHHLMSIFGQL